MQGTLLSYSLMFLQPLLPHPLHNRVHGSALNWQPYQALTALLSTV